jgi:hypothetical protein
MEKDHALDCIVLVEEGDFFQELYCANTRVNAKNHHQMHATSLIFF